MSENGQYYTCADCGGIFEKDITDEEAKASFRAEFGIDPPPEQTTVVCEDCYVKIQMNRERKLQ